MIGLVVCASLWDPDGSEELQYGHRLLRRSVGEARISIAPQPGDLASLWPLARRLVMASPELTDDAPVLLLGHPHVLISPTSLQLLGKTLASHPQAIVQGFDSGAPWTGSAPDYCTARGLERYETRLPQDKAFNAPLEAGRLVSMTLAGTLRRHAALPQQAAIFQPAAFAHDYSGYHSGTRDEVIALLPASAQRVLDVGGGAGGFLRALKAARRCETHLAEFSPQACEAARAVVDQVWQGDFLSGDFGTTFDCITFLDVLEHAEHPLQWLARARDLLTPDGCVVASIPNVGHWSVLADLIEGRWDYAPVGIHCITHLRFFTRHGIDTLFAQAGLELEDVRPVPLARPQWWRLSVNSERLAIDEASLDTYAYLVRARPKT